MKEKISYIYKFIILIVTGIGLYLNFKLFTFQTAILYFTNISNVLVFVFYLITLLLALFKKLNKNNIYYILKGMVTMAITITMFVYQLMISNGDNSFSGHMLECNFVHLIVPLLVIFDYIIFGEKGNLKKEYPFIWSLILVAYQIFVVIYSNMGGTFMGSNVPYPYMDVETIGWGKAILNCFVILIFFIGYGDIVQYLDYKLGKKKQ